MTKTPAPELRSDAPPGTPAGLPTSRVARPEPVATVCAQPVTVVAVSDQSLAPASLSARTRKV